MRKFIILDASKTDPLTILGLAAAILALGSVHWLVRDQDRKDAAEQDQVQGLPTRPEQLLNFSAATRPDHLIL